MSVYDYITGGIVCLSVHCLTWIYFNQAGIAIYRNFQAEFFDTRLLLESIPFIDTSAAGWRNVPPGSSGLCSGIVGESWKLGRIFQ